ncbi:unnamed protein product, partial [Durusdinium trenchii]
LQPDIVTYSSGISACEKAARWTEALSVLEMADVIAFNAAISALEKAGRWEAVFSVFNTMSMIEIQPDLISMNAARQPHQKSRALLGSGVVPYSAAVSACGWASKWQEAMSLLEELVCLWKPDVIAFCAAISACERAAQWTKVLELLKDMRL